MSALLPATRAVLAKATRATPPFFSNMGAAELFEAEHSRGSLTVLPRTDGGYVVVTRDAPLGAGTLAGPMTLGEAHAELLRRTEAH